MLVRLLQELYLTNTEGRSTADKSYILRSSLLKISLYALSVDCLGLSHPSAMPDVLGM